MQQCKTGKKKLQGLFFDFDGVLVDSTAIKIEGFRELFQHIPEAAQTKILEYHRMHGGISRVEKIQYAYNSVLEIPLAGSELIRLEQNYSDLVMEKVVHCSLVNGALDLLEQFRHRSCIFLISGTPERELQKIVERRNMQQYFLEILGSPVRKPVHVNRLLERYKLDPQRCVFIGDALTDYSAAQQTGLDFIGIQRDVTFPPGTISLPDCAGVAKVLARSYYWEE